MARRDLLTEDERRLLFGIPNDRARIAAHDMLTPATSLLGSSGAKDMTPGCATMQSHTPSQASTDGDNNSPMLLARMFHY